ncbi:MAG: hypothetical protein AAFP70_07470 [Calditrichota bacterium]
MLPDAIERFMNWLEQYGLEGYDLYDLWATGYGKWAKGLYHKRKAFGAPFVIPVFLADFLWPGVRRIVAAKKRYATSDAHFAKAYLFLYELTDKQEYLKKAIKIADEMLTYASDGYSGPCWGYPFDWQTNRGLWPKGIPFITSTPYVYHVFTKLYDVTKVEKFHDVARGIAAFAQFDLNKTLLPNGTTASSYSPLDNTSVVNANAYRAELLVDSAIRFDNKEQLAEAEETIRFVLAAQDEDGSWLYDVVNPHDNFVDNFHTCFVLKKLYQLNKHLQREDIRLAIQRGYDFYLDNLLDESGLPIPFWQVNRMQLVKREMYDFAEGINLGVLLADDHPKAWETAKRLATGLLEKYQTREGYFIARELLLGKQLSLPMPRWPQAQLIAALTALQVRMTNSQNAIN